MTRLRPLVLFFLLGAAPAGVEPSVDFLISDAEAFVPVSCQASKVTCPKVKDILKGYLEELAKANGCLAKPCTVEAIEKIYRRDQQLDELEDTLPPRARFIDGRRPLLRLSLLVTGRAGMALGKADPTAQPPIGWNVEVLAPKQVEMVCTKYPAHCATAGGLVKTAKALQIKAGACAKTPCDYPEHDSMAVEAEAATGDFFLLSSRVDVYTLPIFSLLADARTNIAKNIALVASAKLGELEAAEKDLLARVAVLASAPAAADAAKFDALNSRGAQLIGLYQQASVSSDRTYALLGDKTESDKLRARVNASAARLASARAQLAAVKASKLFGTAEGEGPHGVAFGRIKTSLAGAGGGGSSILVREPREPGKFLIDRRAMPIPPPKDPSAPPILAKDPGIFGILANVGSDDEEKRVDALRRLNLTRTVGNPAGRARYVHKQNAPDTCAVVAQQSVLLAHGMLPQTDPVAQEAALAAEAKSRGFYRAGTPDAYTANLLVERGLLVAKQSDASIATLDAAVRRGGMIIANVDARGLWNIKNPAVLGHAIVITGAEIGRLGDETLGYYINDSGSLVAGAGRFVPIEQFKLAWNAHTRTFAEVK